MNRIKKTTTYTILGLAALLLASTATPADELGEAVQAAIRNVEPSIVRLRVIGGEQSIDGAAVRSLVTTGIVISDTGEILTSQFALEGQPEAVLVEDQDGNRTNATVVATDSVRQIVLLQAKEGQWTPAGLNLNRPPEVGQWSVALGRFYAAESSNVSVGIISALNRIHGMAIQTDAKISPVNYGGPLISLSGDVLGILVPLSPRGTGTPSSGVEWYDSGIGFAIPLSDALASAEKLRSGKDLKPGRIGIRLVPAGAFDTKVEIDRVHPGGPAEKSGIRKGDRIIAIDEQAVDRSSVLMETLARHYAGDSVTVRIRRGEEERTIPVELAEALQPIARGYLGLLPVRPAKPKEELSPAGDAANAMDQKESIEIPHIKLPDSLKEQGGDEPAKADPITLIVTNDSPAAATLPSGIELLSLNGTQMTTVAALAIAMEDVTPKSIVKLEYRAIGEETTQEAQLTAANRPETVVELSDSVLAELQQAWPAGSQPAVDKKAATADKDQLLPQNGMARQEFDFAERGKCVVLTSSQPSSVMPGIVILLAASDSSEEEIVRQWGPFLHSRCISIGIPKNPEAARLASEDIPLVLTTIRAMVSRVGADLQRVILVADRTQAQLAWQCTFGGPSNIRGIALTDGWYSGSEVENINGAGQSVLLLDPTEGVQARALIDLSRKSLNAAGFWAPMPVAPSSSQSAEKDRSRFRTIADWSLQLRSF